MKSKLASGLLLSLTLTMSLSAMVPVFSADDAGTTAADTSNAADSSSAPATANTSVPADQSATTTSQPATRTLQGEINVVQVDLQDLSNVGLDMKRVRTALKHLYDEAARQPVTIQEEPEMIGDTIIQIPISFTGGGFLPMRKAWVDASMANIQPFVQLASNDIGDFTSGQNQLEFPDNVKDKLQPYIQQWVSTVGTMSSHMSVLQPLTAGPTYDNQAILDATKAMDNDVKALERTRRDLYKILQKEGKHAQEQAKRAGG